MKKLLSVILTVMLAFALFTACGKKAQTGSQAGESKTSYEGLGIGIELTSEEYGIGFRKGSDLTNEVNKIMDELKENGTLQAIAGKYDVVISDGTAPEEEEATLKDLDYIKANGKLIVGITDYKPMNFKDKKGEWTGFDTEFAKAVCEKLGVEVEFIEIDWDNKFLALESKSIDCIWNGMTISEEVLKNTSCSKPYARNAQVVVMDEDKLQDYKTAEDMKDLTFAAEAGSAGYQAAVDNGFKNVVEAGAQTDALLEVASGSSDACIIDLTMAQAMLKK